MSIKINDHSFYQDPRFKIEKKVLTKLTEICGWDTNIATITYFPGGDVHIGILSDQQKIDKIPLFKTNGSIRISISSKENPLPNPENISEEVKSKILDPISSNWIRVAICLIESHAEECGERFKELFERNLDYWKKIHGVA